MNYREEQNAVHEPRARSFRKMHLLHAHTTRATSGRIIVMCTPTFNCLPLKQEHVYPILERALASPVPQMQCLAMQLLPGFQNCIDFAIMKSTLLPLVQV